MTTDLALPSAVAPATSQATVVEQSRAVAEVAAAVRVARDFPRDESAALDGVRQSFSHLIVAERAFYSVPNRGQGMSVHAAREMARIWGNVDYGVRELRRDDDAGTSEMQAWAWDQQTNVRSTRSFIQPHARMKGRQRQVLTDLHDIYLGNQNTGAKAVRECIFTVLPDWLIAEADRVARETITRGTGEPIGDRVRKTADSFNSRLGVSDAQLEEYIGRPLAKWTPDDLARLQPVWTSITQEGIPAADFFPEVRTTLDAEAGA